MFTNRIYQIYMYIQDLTLNNLKGLMRHKAKPNQTKQNHLIHNFNNSHDKLDFESFFPTF